ncbi:hypothetical protein KEM48_007142 [Puccinia striiformis f. sp. tritici PST-130]|nr:hypothetical protein KEM48_007142 [Puccinia striiformis f. sp. tritici PST-130]
MAIESQTQQPDQGNETDQSQTQNRRSRQASSIVTAPNMVAAPLDSRVSMSGQPVVKACKRPAEPSSEQESVASVGSVKSKGKSKGKSKNKKKSQSKKGKKQKSTSGAAEVCLRLLGLQWRILISNGNSGSNNNTMASAMYELIHGGNTSETADELEWDPTTMHVRCICHKFALIVNAGLAALDLKTLPPAKAKESVLGFFPVLGRLTEVEEPDSALPPFNPNQGNVDGIQEIEVVNVEEEYSEGDYRNADNEGLDVGAESDGGYSDSHTSEIVKVNSSDGKHVRSSKLLALTTKFQSYKKAVDARDVIDQILKEDQESNEAGDFGDVLFSPREWKEIDNLNQELEVFVELTSQMEGNSATGAHVIPKYLELKESLTAKLLQAQMQDSLYPMYHAMLKRVERYLDEAMRCNTLVIATVMHPCYRMHLFELAFGPESTEVTKCLSLLDREFQRVKQTQQQPTDPDPDITVIKRPPGLVPTSLMERLATRMVQKATPQGNEIEAYLNANISFEKGAIDHKTTPLKWWKCLTHDVGKPSFVPHSGSFGSRVSCSAWELLRVERLFSAASDVCSSRRGSLLPSTMSHCVSSLMWLREDVLLDGDFEEAEKL